MNRSIQNVVIGNLAPMGANPNAPSRSSVNRDNLSAGLEVANPQKRKLSQKSAMVILDNGDETDPKTPKKGKAKGNAKGNSMEKKMEFQNNMLNTFRLTQEANTAHATSRNDIAQKNFAFKEKSYNNQLKIQDNKQKLSEWKATKRFDLEEKKMVQKKQEMDMRLLTQMSSDAYMKYRDEEDPDVKDILKGEMRVISEALKKKIREMSDDNLDKIGNSNQSQDTTGRPNLQALHPIRVETRALDTIEQADSAINQAKEISEDLWIKEVD